MKHLETFVDEKLRVSKGSTVPDLVAIVKSKDRKEFKSRCQQLSEYLINDSDLPIADLVDWKNGLKQLARRYKNGYDTFLWCYRDDILYGTWDNMYSMIWSISNACVNNRIYESLGFKDFTCNDEEIIESNGVFIVTENTEFTEQIDYLMKKAERG